MSSMSLQKTWVTRVFLDALDILGHLMNRVLL